MIALRRFGGWMLDLDTLWVRAPFGLPLLHSFGHVFGSMRNVGGLRSTEPGGWHHKSLLWYLKAPRDELLLALS